MVVKDAGTGEHAVLAPVVLHQVITGHLGDSIDRSRIKRCLLVLLLSNNSTEHLARPGEVKTATGRKLLDGSEQIMGAVDIVVQDGNLVLERVADKAGSGQVIALVGNHVLHRLYDGEDIIEGSHMQVDPVDEMDDVLQFVGSVLNGGPPDDAVNLVPLGQEQFRKIRAVLSGKAGDEGFLLHCRPSLHNYFSKNPCRRSTEI